MLSIGSSNLFQINGGAEANEGKKLIEIVKGNELSKSCEIITKAEKTFLKVYCVNPGPNVFTYVAVILSIIIVNNMMSKEIHILLFYFFYEFQIHVLNK